MANWFKDAVIYQIYPQSYYDTNADGIGDLNGIREKLGYIQSLGCNTVWLSPCFVSPFEDAGYDVADYYKIAPRYGTNDDMKALVDACHQKDMHILLDLVIGHTSISHPWFKESAENPESEHADFYIWTDEAAHCDNKEVAEKLVPYPAGKRKGKYMYNFFDIQPAINFGFGTVTEPWQMPTDHPAVKKNIEEVKNIMRFWLSMGVDGFRVDMAASLVKNDTPEKTYTRRIWADIRKMLDTEFPEAVIVSEWFNAPQAINGGEGFDADFYLQGNPGFMSLMMVGENSFFNSLGEGTCTFFAEEYKGYIDALKGTGRFMCTPTGNHDVVRMSSGRSDTQRKLDIAFTMLLPGIPAVYYGDEIGMRYIDLPTKEGGGYRTGSRTPMQWKAGKNLGFSEADSALLYLPVDMSADAPTVESEEADKNSLLNFTREMLAFRKAHPALCANMDFENVYAKENRYPYIFLRTDGKAKFLCAFNPAARTEQATVARLSDAEVVKNLGDCTLTSEGHATTVSMAPESFAVIAFTSADEAFCDTETDDMPAEAEAPAATGAVGALSPDEEPIGLGSWEGRVSTLFFKGTVHCNVAYENGAYQFSLEIPDVPVPAYTITSVQKVSSDTLEVHAEIKDLQNREAVLTATFHGDSFDCTVKIPFFGKVKIKDGRRAK